MDLNVAVLLSCMQVFLLLQSSDRIAHDICHAFDGCTGGAAGATQQLAGESAAANGATADVRNNSGSGPAAEAAGGAMQACAQPFRYMRAHAKEIGNMVISWRSCARLNLTHDRCWPASGACMWAGFGLWWLCNAAVWGTFFFIFSHQRQHGDRQLVHCRVATPGC